MLAVGKPRLPLSSGVVDVDYEGSREVGYSLFFSFIYSRLDNGQRPVCVAFSERSLIPPFLAWRADIQGFVFALGGEVGGYGGRRGMIVVSLSFR